MDTQEFSRAYEKSRNGANFFVHHWLVKSFEYSDGVKECADIGCHWLMDILATEVPPVIRGNAAGSNLGIVYVRVDKGAATMTMELEDGKISWARHVAWTDMPEGEWIFYIADEGARLAMILPTEY